MEQSRCKKLRPGDRSRDCRKCGKLTEKDSADFGTKSKLPGWINDDLAEVLPDLIGFSKTVRHTTGHQF